LLDPDSIWLGGIILESGLIKSEADTEKIRVKCPNCTSKKVIKRGRSEGKFRTRQRYECKECGKRFADISFKYMKHTPQVIFNALNFYNLGHNLEETSKEVNKKFKVKTSKSTIHCWIHEFGDFCPIRSFRKEFSRDNDVLFTKRFEHENLDYLFMYHKFKLDSFVKDKFSDLANYIIRFEKGCPDVFFEVGKRCSSPIFGVSVEAREEKNLACKMAGFASSAAISNHDRHKLVERFMIINDKATIACELPVWYWDKKADLGITGHIDMIQVRNNLVYLVDYKPNATQDKKAASQLYFYASALSYRAKLPFDKIRCAWFDEESYFEYAPANASQDPSFG